MDKVLEKLKAFIGSPEHIEMLHKQEIKERIYKSQLDRFHNLSIEDKIKFIKACRSKYESKEYQDKEYSLGYEPRTPLYSFLFDYAVEYGRSSCYNINEYFPEDQFEIAGKFIIGQIYGQGTITYCYDFSDKQIIIPHYINNIITIFNSDGNKIVTTNNYFTIMDFIQQYNSNNYTGYTYSINDGEKYPLNQFNKI